MPAGSGLVVDAAFKYMFDHTRRQHHNGCGANGIVRHYMLGVFWRQLAQRGSACPRTGAAHADPEPAARHGEFRLRFRCKSPVGGRAMLALAQVDPSLSTGAYTVDSFRGLRADGMMRGSGFCTAERDMALGIMAESRGHFDHPQQGRYVLVWQGSQRTYLLISSILLLTGVACGRRRLFLCGQRLEELGTRRFAVAQLLKSTSALELSGSTTLEQVSIRPVDAAGRTAISPQMTLLVPPDGAENPA